MAFGAAVLTVAPVGGELMFLPGVAASGVGLLPVGTYVAQVGGDPAVAGINYRKTGPSAVNQSRGGAVEERNALKAVRIGFGVGTVLGAFVNNDPLNAADADTGVITTALALAGEVSLPNNFGPGRGNWTTEDLARVSVNFYAGDTASGVVQGVGIFKAIVAGNLIIRFHNNQIVVVNGQSGAGAAPGGIDILYVPESG